MRHDDIPRRRFLVTALSAAGGAAARAFEGVIGPAGAAIGASACKSPSDARHERDAGPSAEPLRALNATQYAFVEAAVDTLIPADDLSPSGSACGVAVFIDRQLAGAYGAGARLYREGPFARGKPEHGYQLALTPREFFCAGIEATNASSQRAHGVSFDALGEPDRVAVLTALEKGEGELEGVDPHDFFELLLSLTMEGFFADPIYGGNRGKVGWSMVGYPGLPATYRNEIETHRGKPIALSPRSIDDFT